jgi:hypothetical protein
MPKKSTEPMRKITVSLPVALLEWLDSKIEGRTRSAFIAAAIEAELDRVETVQVIEETAGSWKDEDYPDLATGKDIDRWIAELRGYSYEPEGQMRKVAEPKSEYKAD